jgi:hypothetical protein
MNTVFTISLVLGSIALIAWIVLSVVASTASGWQDVDPDRWAGVAGRIIVAYFFGFGMAGLSASFAGWAVLPSILAAIAGGLALGAVAVWLGPQPEG